MHAEAVVIDPRKSRCQRLRRTVTEAAKLHERHASWQSRRLGRSAYRKTFITLTYRPGEAWQARHISRYVRLMRQWFQRRDEVCRFAWVGELQGRGALHYHLLVWVPRRLRLPRPDQSGWWPHGMSNIETARNPVGYMVKYATKTRPEDVKRLPKGVRLHGNGGHDPGSRVTLRERLWPVWVQREWDQRRVGSWVDEMERGKETDDERRARLVDEESQWCTYARRYEAKGFPRLQRVCGGFVDLVTGELIETPWVVSVDRGVVCVYPKTRTVQ